MTRATAQPDFWSSRFEVNARRAIYHQWEQLEASGCIHNFRLAAGQAGGFREGWFFADSDAYKWLDAASRIWAAQPQPRLGALMDELIDLIARAQAPDGYIFTYNQIHFPGVRWVNLQIEHELYCHGHLIEAGVSHYQATRRTDLLEIARRAAGRVVADFSGKGASYTPGHEEIEIALLRLHQVAPDCAAYYEMARQFLEQRGRTPLFALSLLRQNLRVGQRGKFVQQKKAEYLQAHPDFKPYQLPPGNISRKPRNATLRWYASALSGKYFQQHAPIREQTTPVGHCVRFAYLETAVAMLARLSHDPSLLPALEAAWERMVRRRMYLTGGIGAVPGSEGFGNDDELDPEYAYAETCAALGCLFWNWEMAQLTGEAKYSDLFEWQLYNAASVGMGLDGTTYLYNNPLVCRGGVTRQPWYAVPCCPSNLSRTWASLGGYVSSSAPGRLYLHQYISSELRQHPISGENGATSVVRTRLSSALPWQGKARIELVETNFSNPGQPTRFDLYLRQPSWCSRMQVAVNGEPAGREVPQAQDHNAQTWGYDPHPARFQVISRPFAPGDVIEIDFDLPIRLRRPRPELRGHAGRLAVTRGPLVYCLENLDNPNVDIFSASLEPASLTEVPDSDLLGGIIKIVGKTSEGQPLTFIPYFLWGNRGPSRMAVWVMGEEGGRAS